MTQPLEPLYTLKVAAEMIPMTSTACLRTWLSRHAPDFPPRYRYGRYGIMRLLSLSELTRIRSHVVIVKPYPLAQRRGRNIIP